MSDELDETLPGEAGEAPQEVAYADAQDITYKGETLKPFGFIRRMAAIALGLKYWKLTSDDMQTIVNPRYKQLQALIAEREATKNEQDTEERDMKIARLSEEIAEIGEQDDEVTIYDDIVNDAMIVIWLCSHKDSICQRARRNPKEYLTQIDKWGAANEIFIGETMVPNPEAMDAFMRLVGQINESDYKPERKGTEDPEKN